MNNMKYALLINHRSTDFSNNIKIIMSVNFISLKKLSYYRLPYKLELESFVKL